MKIGDRVYVHGYVDEIRNDVVVIRNNGGYFGTVKSEIIVANNITGQEIMSLDALLNSGKADQEE